VAAGWCAALLGPPARLQLTEIAGPNSAAIQVRPEDWLCIQVLEINPVLPLLPLFAPGSLPPSRPTPPARAQLSNELTPHHSSILSVYYISYS
jgi:hypothetical protein